MQFEYKHIKSIFVPYAEDALKRARIALKVKGYSGKKTKTNSTGKLSDGLDYQITQSSKGDNLTLEFTSNEVYGAFIEEGVNGTKIKHGSPYSFTKKNIDQKAIIKWLESPKIRLRKMTKTKSGGVSNVFIEKNAKNIKASAFAIGRSIALKGIRGIGFMSKSQNYAFEDYKADISEAFTKDVAESMANDLLSRIPNGAKTTVKIK